MTHFGPFGRCAILTLLFIFYLLEYVTLRRISKCSDRKKNRNKNWTCTKIVQNHQTFASIISVEQMSIRLKVNFGPKNQYYSYHYNGFYPRSCVSSKPDNYFVVFR